MYHSIVFALSGKYIPYCVCVCVCVCAYMPIADTDIVGYTFGYLAVFMYESK